MDERMTELMNEVRRLRRMVWSALAIASIAVIGLLEPALAAKVKAADILKLRQLSIIDANGIERVRIGAPLPDPIMNGKRGKRDEPASGILIYDAKGNERGGYVTDNGGGNALLTLDDGSGEDQVTIVSYSERGAEFGLRNHAQTRFAVSALNDRTALKLQHNGKVLLTEDSGH
jgi:hypothetical protein